MLQWDNFVFCPQSNGAIEFAGVFDILMSCLKVCFTYLCGIEWNAINTNELATLAALGTCVIDKYSVGLGLVLKYP